MSGITAVTSVSTEGYWQYGKEGIQSLLAHWPGKVIVYYEHDEPGLRNGNLEWRDLFAQQGVPSFLKTIGAFPLFQGWVPGEPYNYNFDAYKFSRKVFAVTDPARKDDGLVFWVDADVRLKRDVPPEFLASLLDGYYTCYLGREGYHSECGFVGFNARNEWHGDFMRAFRNAYTTGMFARLPGYHDCWVYDWVRRGTKVPAHNLSPTVKVEHVDPVTVKPLVGEKLDCVENSPLDEYMVHLKGGRKFDLR